MQILTLFALATAALAHPPAALAYSHHDHIGVVTKPYLKAGRTDSRSPCPLLNTLANHGYLPHNGRGITVENIGDAVLAATHWSSDFGTIPATNAFAGLNKTVIDLEDLDTPAGTEHPASLTRLDSPADSNDLNMWRLNALLGDSKTSYLNVASLAKSRNRVDGLSPALTAAQESTSQAEAALLLTLMMDGGVPAAADATEAFIAGSKAPKNRVRAWLKDERFPIAEGWKPSTRLVQFADFSPFSDAIKTAQG
ncbi:Cloroperoxidase [Xylariaceae sp. FL0016]|nr:Cloroperoxidase [Xylariaceae sp. FL0016]